MERIKFYSVALALVLKVAPLSRVFYTTSALRASPVAILINWAVGLAAVAGIMHAVSGATFLCDPTTSTANGTVGEPFEYVARLCVDDGFGTYPFYKVEGVS